MAQIGPAVGAHLHNTRNTGYANALAAIEGGAVLLDASLGGIGGCPCAPRHGEHRHRGSRLSPARGGNSTGVALEALIGVAEWLEGVLGHQLDGQVYRAGGFAPASG